MLELVVAFCAIVFTVMSIVAIILGLMYKDEIKNTRSYPDILFSVFITTIILWLGIVLTVYTANVFYTNSNKTVIESKSIKSLNHDNNLLNKGE